MHRGLRISTLLVLTLLVACQGRAPTIRWLSPAAGGTLSGKVRLSVAPLGEPAPPNVVFSLGDREIGKAYLSGDVYEAVFDTSVIDPGTYTLHAVPYGAPSLPLEVVVARNVPNTSGTVTGTPESPEGDLSLGSDPINLGGLLDLWGDVGGGSTAEAALYAPGDFPWKSLWRGSAVRARARGLFTQQTEVTELPRGYYSYNEETQAWEGVPAGAGSLLVDYSYPDPETRQTHEIVITVDWESAGKTQVVKGQMGDAEVPTAARIFVTDNDEIILDLDVAASWRKPEGCREAILEPEMLSLVGYTSHDRPEDGDVTPEQEDGDAAPERPEIDASDLELLFTVGVDPLTNEDRLDLSLDLVTLAGAAQASLNLEVAATGETLRKDCFASGGTVSSLSLATEIGVGLEDGPRRGSRFSVAAGEPEYNRDGLPTSAFIEGEVATFDENILEESITSYSGRLDETNGDGFPGENVRVVLPEGNTTLDVYVSAIFEIYRAMIAEKIAEPR